MARIKIENKVMRDRMSKWIADNLYSDIYTKKEVFELLIKFAEETLLRAQKLEVKEIDWNKFK